MYPWLSPYWQRLEQAVRQQRLSHAWLLSGSRGMGKRQLALQLAHRVLCETPGPDGACGRCHACQLLSAGNHPDLHLLGDEEESRSIGIDTVRGLSARMQASPQLGRAKVALLIRAERMTDAAANALLKTLEEPPGSGLLLLLADRSHQLLPTIVSRCQRLHLACPDETSALAWLRSQAGGEAAQSFHLRLNQGAPLQTLEYLLSGADAQRRDICTGLAACFERPWELVALSGRLREAMPRAFGWLQLLLLDALKWQATGQPEWLGMQDARPLIERLAGLPSAHLLACHASLLEQEQQLARMPSAVPGLLMTHWLTQLLLKED